MNSLQDHEVTINIALFKRYHFYQLFDPNGPRAFGFNIHRSVNVACATIVLAINVFSALSYFTDTKNTVDTIDALLIMFIYSVNVITFLKMFVFLRQPAVVWDLFNFTRLDFLTGSRCRRNLGILSGYRDTSIKMTDFFMNYTSAVFMTWMVVPLVYNAFSGSSDIPNLQRYQNIFNMNYPVTTTVFNRYYGVFYAMEATMGAFILYNSVLVDIFLISMCLATIGQFEVLGTTFASIGRDVDESTSRRNNDEYKNNSLKAYIDFKSILYDQTQVYKKLKSFYSLIWIIVVSLIFVNSIAITILTYSFIVILMSAESFTIFRLIKLPTAYVCFALQIFLYCYLFGVLNDKKESVNFGIYSCDWTKMDLKFKKLLLLAMRMNNANNLMIKTSPTNKVNMQLFAHVKSCSNISTTPILMRSLKHKCN